MNRIILSAATLVITACGVSESTTIEREVTQGTTQGLTWTQFRSQKVVVDADRGAFIADGDTPFFSEKALREFYELNVRSGQLVVNRMGNADDKWSDSKKNNLTYCVSDNFGARKAAVVQAMQAATQQWSAAGNVTYVYQPNHDANCTKSNTSVVFNVRQVNAGGQYLASAFFPGESRSSREVVIDPSSFETTSLLRAVVLHELGHTLGFRHEHTRPEAGTCFEDSQYRALTPYDIASSMHYPQCNGLANWTTTLSAMDKQGVAALYGPAGASSPTPPPSTPAPSGATVDRFTATIARNATQAFGPFAVAPGSTFEVAMSGTGDADLYVRFGSAPTASAFHCRPYLDDSNEQCALTVPTGVTQVFVNVSGYTAAAISLTATYYKPAAAPPAPTGSRQVGQAGGAVGTNEFIQYNAIKVVPGTALRVTMTGSGDPDLYVRFGQKASLTLFDCRPYVNGASEECQLTVPAGQTDVYVAIHGYVAGNYRFEIEYTAP